MSENEKVAAKEREERDRNSFDKITFTDPLSETTRRTKRNLLIVGLLSVITYLYPVSFSSLFGMKVEENQIPPEVVSGFLVAVLIYFLLQFLMHFIIDFLGWHYQREAQKIDAFSKIFSRVESWQLKIEKDIEHCIGVFEDGKSKHYNDDFDPVEAIKNLDTSQKVYYSHVYPELKKWDRNVRSMSLLLNFRVLLRFLSLWSLEFTLPLGLGVYGLVGHWGGFEMLLCKVFGCAS